MNTGLGQITIFQKRNGPLTKRIWLVNGKPVDDGTECRMAHRTARRKIKLDRRCDRERPCCEECCGEICEGKGPHRHALLCANCGRHRGWLSGRAADILLDLYLRRQLTDAPVLRDGSIRP